MGNPVVEHSPPPPPQLTAEEYREWRQTRDAERAARVAQHAVDREAGILSGSIPPEQLTGRELARHYPELFDGY
ncbi:hypothetical protein ACKKBG_A26835 [Auxenochlorella protothecoides x Auxenochlorella symbiontica]